MQHAGFEVKNPTDFVCVDGELIKAKLSEHESGQPMLVFMPFRLQPCTAAALQDVLGKADRLFAARNAVVRICLDCGDGNEQALLEQEGFKVDGYGYSLEVEALRRRLPERRHRLPEGLRIERMDYGQDIEAVVQLEKAVHAADTSSRVNFETPQAVASMRGYYQRACAGLGVYLLRGDMSLVGLLGFLPDGERQGAVHISSVSIASEWQGKGLFFPFLLACFALPDLVGYKVATGVTTTSRLIAAARIYGIDLISVSLSRGPC